MPLHLKKKMKLEKNKMRTFEIMPPSGSLLPGQKINIQIKFMPTEEVRCYCYSCLLYTSPSPRDKRQSRMPSSA